MQPTDMPAPKLSVLINTFNHRRFIAQAIESVLMQETDFSMEIVICDDCSTDGTRQIVLEYGNRFPGLIHLLLPEENIGMNRSFDLAWRACRGAYVAFLDGDDYWTSAHKLQRQVDYLERHRECAACFHSVLRVYDGIKQGSLITGQSRSEYVTVADLVAANFIESCSLVIRNGVVVEFPDEFYETTAPDWLFNLYCAQQGFLGYIDEVMAVYRKHTGGVYTSSSRIEKLRGEIFVHRYLYRYLGNEYHFQIRNQLADDWRALAIELAKTGQIAEASISLRNSLTVSPFGTPKTIERILTKSVQRERKKVYGTLKNWMT